MNEFENKVAIVTGTTGIGRAIAERLASGGASVLACGIDEAANRELQQESDSAGFDVRVKLCEGGWLLDPSGSNTTHATYTIYTDSGGVIPDFIKNAGSQIGIRKIFTAISRQVQDPKYAAAK